ncbi:hypothetical protein TNCV_2496111 [Trichonephila clavipes]|nr:hypothetical protein TNCV_2496111 [Trichonephila clavipes]
MNQLQQTIRRMRRHDTYHVEEDELEQHPDLVQKDYGLKRADYVGCGVLIEDIMHGDRLDTSCSVFTPSGGSPSLANNLSTSSSSTTPMSTPLTASPLQNTTTTSNTILSTSQDAKQTSKPRKKRLPTNTSTSIKPKIEIKMTPHKPRKPAAVE